MEQSKVIILGVDGTLGQALKDVFKDQLVTGLSLEQLDVTKQDALDKTLVPLLKEEGRKVLINATAVNAVDAITTDETVRNLAYAVNAVAAGVLAGLAKQFSVPFIHYSTDYVFDGTQRTPYTEESQPNPQSEYAKTKRAGEVATLQVNPDALVIRTSRLFGSTGTSVMSKKSFVEIVKQGAKAGKPMQFVDEEVAGPTWVHDLALFTRQLLEQQVPGGVYHGTNSGSCTWYGFAQEILKQLESTLQITPTSASTFPRPAARPAYSVLVSTKVPQLRSWQEALAAYVHHS